MIAPTAGVSATKEYPLANGDEWELTVNEQRVLLRHKDASSVTETTHWNVLSSAVLNGGLRSFSVSPKSSTSSNASSTLQVLNAKVPSDYDGVTPNAQELLQQLCLAQGLGEPDQTVGLLTAASMKTMTLTSSVAKGTCGTPCRIDAVVTAGVSNARAAGAQADVFFFQSPQSTTNTTIDDDNNNNNTTNDSEATEPTASNQPPFGTINTIVLTDLPLNPSTALVEAYAVILEAKCRAVADLGLACASNPLHMATGTGTDSTVLVGRARDSSLTGGPDQGTDVVMYAGKHMLAGELLGQAVYEATREAVETNLKQWWNPGHAETTSLTRACLAYRCWVLGARLRQAFLEGHRPRIPSQPMKPIPLPHGYVWCVGVLGLMILFTAFHLASTWTQWASTDSVCESGYTDAGSFLGRARTNAIQPSISVLLAVFWGDRYLGSIMMPLAVHPVILIGKGIKRVLTWIPAAHFAHEHPVRGVISGIALWMVVLLVSQVTAAALLVLPQFLLELPSFFGSKRPGEGTCWDHSSALLWWWSRILESVIWCLQVYLLRGALSLKLLCNVGLQMAHYLERGQLAQARNQLCWLCSRDASDLQSEELAGATLESLSENLSDSVVAPLFFYVLGGSIGALAFRTANTLDSMVGYKGGKYEYVGKPSARLDDFFCFVPARLTSLLLALAAALRHQPPQAGSRSVEASETPTQLLQKGLSVAWRDASQCDSPNAGWPMGTMAGLLDVRLEKKGQYSLNGPLHGGSGRAPGYPDIREGHTITERAGCLTYAVVIVSVVLLRFG